MTESVFLVLHNTDPVSQEDAKLLGIFSSREKAQGRVDRARNQPGFADAPDGFIIDEYTIDKDEWQEGYVIAD